MVDNQIYEFLFKRAVEDLDALLDHAPDDVLRGRVKYARSALLDARPWNPTDVTIPKRGSTIEFAESQAERLNDEPAKRPGLLERVWLRRKAQAEIEPPSGADSGPHTEVSEIYSESRPQRSREWLKVLGEQDAARELAIQTEETHVATPCCGPDAVPTQADFRGTWKTRNGQTAVIRTFAATNNLWYGHIEEELPRGEKAWKTDGDSLHDPNLDLMERIREGKNYR